MPESQQYLAQEIDNIVTACNAIKDELLAGGPKDLTPVTIKRFNAQVLDGLELDPDVVPGHVRTHSVVVARYRGAPWQDCEYLLGRLCEWLAGDFAAPDENWLLPYAILKAIAAHLYLAWIHPFGDGNGRTARLMELEILLAAGVPTPATHLLSNHYNQTRTEYQRRLDEASRDEAGEAAFLKYAVRGFVDGLADALALIREQQFDDRWEQYIYEQFGEASTPTKRRQRQLVLDITDARRPVARTEFHELSPPLAASYASKTRKTLTRDVNALLAMGLIRREPFIDASGRPRVGYVPNRELIQAFLPIST